MLPREAAARKQSLRKDSSAKKAEINILADRLVISAEYKWLKEIAKEIAIQYRTAPGATPAEDHSYLTHCKILWAYNKMFEKVESYAKMQQRRKPDNANNGW